MKMVKSRVDLFAGGGGFAAASFRFRDRKKNNHYF